MTGRLRETDNSDAYVKIVEDNISTQLAAKDEEVVAVDKQPADNAAIDVEVFDLNGKAFNLSDFKGKVVYLYILYSMCGTCRKKITAAKAMKEELSKKEKKNIVYISIDNTETVW